MSKHRSLDARVRLDVEIMVECAECLDDLMLESVKGEDGRAVAVVHPCQRCLDNAKQEGRDEVEEARP